MKQSDSERFVDGVDHKAHFPSREGFPDLQEHVSGGGTTTLSGCLRMFKNVVTVG